MRTKNNKIFWLFVLFTILISLMSFVNADMGPKPSIDVKLKNMYTTDYLLDLFVYEDVLKNSFADYNGRGLTREQIDMLHGLNFDGWISEGTRWGQYCLMADCAGNSKFEHHFGYFGTPTIYRVVVVNNKTGEIKISDVIHREDFHSEIEVDALDMKVVDKGNTTFIIQKSVSCILITIFMELIIAIIMRIHNYRIVFLVNLVTNTIMQACLILLPVSIPYLNSFISLEIIIFLVEYILYKGYFKKVSNKKTILYAIVANMITASLTYILPFVINLIQLSFA